MLADGRAEQLLHPADAGFRREFIEELLELRGALPVRGDLDVVEQEDLVESDLQVRDEVLAKKRGDATLYRPADRRVARRRRADLLVARTIVVHLSARAYVAAVEHRADSIPQSADSH